MGKRKLHGQTYFQCDWTGLPMRQTNCYMPDWNANGKLMKHGSYANWEAVVAHAVEKGQEQRVRDYIDELVGCHVQPAPHWSTLAWFSREEPTIFTAQQFHDECRKVVAPIVAIRISPEGQAHEVFCHEYDIQTRFKDHLTKPFNAPDASPQSFQTVRKRSKERDLTVFYWPDKNGLTFNQVASNAFKMQIYGDALLLQQTREPSFVPRDRYVNYHLVDYQETFTKHNKRKEVPSTLSMPEYDKIKGQMAQELQSLEAQASANASVPTELAKAAILPPPTGAELAALLMMNGHSPPKKRRHSPLSSCAPEGAARP